jgi:rare lipoprotein A
LSAIVASLLAGCGSVPSAPAVEREESAATAPAVASQPRPPRRGGYYKDDGPGDNPPNLDNIVDAEPRIEPLHRFANNPYNIFGVNYTPMKSHAPFKQRGLASWYGRMFHGQRTSSGEPYDMYGMSAAHPTLPIPSYVRVTHVDSGRYAILRVNDRGPFHPGRIIDLSYAAAHKLGFVRQGSAQVEVELLTPQDIARMNRRRAAVEVASAPAASAAPPDALPDTQALTVSAAAPAPVPGAGANRLYLQVGAFTARANAETLRARIVRELAELRDATVEILQRDGAFRVHVGPYRSRNEAAGVAQRMRELFQLSPLFVTR